jgi:hypothetical protein
MIEQGIPTSNSVHSVMGIVSMVALGLGFVVALAELLIKRGGISESKNMLIEILGLGVLLIFSGFLLPSFSILLASGFAVLLIMWPAAYCILFLTRKKERNPVRLIATFMFASYLFLGFLYVYL